MWRHMGAAGNADFMQRFCSKSTGQCSVVKHLSSKVNLRTGHLYIKCKRSLAWHKPLIDITKLPVICDVTALASSETPHDVWSAYCNSVEAYDTQLRAVTGLNPEDSDSWKEVEAPALANFDRAKETFKHLNG
jgi:hypothetical protein